MSKFSSWKQVEATIIAGLKQPEGTQHHNIALERLHRMTVICDYWVDQEQSGYEAHPGESALHPGSFDEVPANHKHAE